jgi:DNA repair exonuclease SbcCD ATPase subunit
MRITHVRIQNILGIEEFEFTPDGFNQISGKNGTGKTSILEAIKAALKGGHDATLLRAGQKKGEIVLLLDDGTEVTRKVTESGSDTVVKREGKRVNKPVDALRQITDALSVNPVQFLLADSKDRVRVLLESLPIEADYERLAKITGMEPRQRQGVHALTVIDDVRQQVYDGRTGTNRAVKEKSATIAQLRQALPPVPQGQADGDEQELRAKLAELDAWLLGEKQRIDTKLEGMRADRDKGIQERMDKIAALQLEISGLREGYTTAEGKANAQRQKNQEKYNADSQPVRMALDRIAGDREAHGRRQQTLETIANLETELESLETQAASETEQLAAIDAYKLELLESLPITGAEVKDGELYIDGVPFDRVNTARQVEAAVELAQVRAGDLGVICVDRIEALDPEALEAFRARATDSGLQMFVTRVTGDDFAIEH